MRSITEVFHVELSVYIAACSLSYNVVYMSRYRVSGSASAHCEPTGDDTRVARMVVSD